MRRSTAAAVVLAVAVSACAATPARTVPTPTPAAETPAAGSTIQHEPFWITVKYRSTPVDIADPGFVYLDGDSSSLVDAAFYDAGNEYMIISLNGTAYHYCGMPDRVWTSLTNASSLGSFYNARIKGSFDCRGGFVPEY